MSEEHIYEDPDILRELEDYVNSFQHNPLSNANKKYDEFENVTLNIAITGESGVGKSTFVNAIRGLTNEDDGAGETGVTETTMKAIRYNHPTMPNVYIWDFPGIGTPNFKAKKYLKAVHFDSYDFFIIIGSLRFTENDVMLAKAIKKMKRPFYFVRSKIDQDVHNETAKKKLTEEQVLSKIRQSCEESLKSLGNPKVFLISTFELEKYDFHDMIDSFANNLSKHKQSALIRSLPVCSLKMIEKKSIQLMIAAVPTALAACTTVAIPIPGVSVGCEIGIMQGFLQGSFSVFGHKPEVELRSMMKSRFAEGVNVDVVAKMMATPIMVVAKTFEAILCCVPLFGTAGALPIAFSTTLSLLIVGIAEMTEDAKAVYGRGLQPF